MAATRQRKPARRPATEDEAKALASPLRMRILRICLHEPRSNKEIAATLGKDPATVLHHVRTLADTGFLEALPPRRGTRGSREIPYLATRKSWTVQNANTGRVLLDTFLEEVALVPIERVDAARLGLRLSPERHEEFVNRFADLLNEFESTPSDRDGQAWSIFFAMHPDPNSPDNAAPA